MNTAYHDYLTAMLAEYPADTDHKQAVTSFIEWVDALEDTEQTCGSEPDVYHYGDAAGTHPIAYLDTQMLGEHGIDPMSVPDPSQLLERWAERLHDELCGDAYVDLYDATLMLAFEDHGTAHSDLTGQSLVPRPGSVSRVPEFAIQPHERPADREIRPSPAGGSRQG